MKLQIFNAENSRQIKTGLPFISIDFKNGIFRITRLAAERIGGDIEEAMITYKEVKDDDKMKSIKMHKTALGR